MVRMTESWFSPCTYDGICRRVRIRHQLPRVVRHSRVIRHDGYRGFQELPQPFVALSGRQHGGAGDRRLDRSMRRTAPVQRPAQLHKPAPAGDVRLGGQLSASGVMKVGEQSRGMVP
jgi:hypothetical protein